MCVHDKNVMRQRTTGAPKPEKNKNIFHNTCAGKQTALQDQRIYKNELLFQWSHLPRGVVVVTLGVKGLKKSEVNLNSAPFNVNLGQYLAQKTNDLHILKLIGFFGERA